MYDVGIAGAGQLARMTCLAAWPLGLRVAVLGRPAEPAAPMAAGVVEGDWKDAEDVARLGAAVGVVTLENEFVEARALAAVESAGTAVRPGAASLAAVQDKARQKDLLASAGLPTAPFQVVDRAGDLATAVAALRRLADQMENAEVESAMRAGWIWPQVAEALGVTRQAVHKKHASRLIAAGVTLRRR